METINLPDDRDDNDLSIVEDAPAERGASSLAAQRDSRPVDDDGKTVLSQAEIDEADEGAPGAPDRT
jgi:hypothetical protein